MSINCPYNHGWCRPEIIWKEIKLLIYGNEAAQHLLNTVFVCFFLNYYYNKIIKGALRG